MPTKPEFLPIINWLPCHKCGAINYGELRLFKAPFAAALPDGSPAQPYVWRCNVELVEDVVTLRLAMDAPPLASIQALLALGRRFARVVRWEREKNGVLESRIFNLFPE